MHFRFFNTYEPVSTLYRDLTPFLVANGHRVDIVMSKAVYRSGRDLDQAVGHLNGVRIIKTVNFGLQPPCRINKALISIVYAWQAAVVSLFGSKVDCNIFLTQPPLFALWGYLLSKIRRQPYLCVVMDVYPQQIVAHGMLRHDAVLTRVLLWLSSFALREARGVVVIGRCMKEQVKAMGVPPERIHCIPNWIDERLIYPVDHEDNVLREKWGLEDRFVVLYAGNMGLSHNFDDILAVTEQMSDRNDVAFVFIGGGTRSYEVQSWVENHQLDNVRFFPFQDISLWAQCFGVGDLHLVVLRESCTGFIVPSRSYSILAAGRPILYQGSSDGEIARMISEEEIGIVVPNGDVEGLRQAILKYINQPDLCQIQGQRGRRLVEGPYSRDLAIEKYAALLVG